MHASMPTREPALSSAARRARGLSLVALTIASILCGTAAQALPVPPTGNWDPAVPGTTTPTTWSSTEPTGFVWNVVDGSLSPVAGQGAITSTWSFDGNNDRMRAASFQGLYGGGTQQPTSFELWIRPAGLAGGGQVIFETGGRTSGLSITLDDDQLLFRVKQGSSVVSLSATLTATDIADFVQVVGVLDASAPPLPGDPNSWLYLNGGLVDQDTDQGVRDWSGNNGSGIARANGQIGGNTGDLSGFGYYAGELAIMRFYENQALDAAQVLQNFDAVMGNVPEPSTGLLLGLGLGMLARLARSPRP